MILISQAFRFALRGKEKESAKQKERLPTTVHRNY